MPLSPGDKLGPYEILSLIGAGGMGEVYKARAAASLNHPHICVLHDISSHDDAGGYMVMEYMEGETLAARIGVPRIGCGYFGTTVPPLSPVGPWPGSHRIDLALLATSAVMHVAQSESLEHLSRPRRPSTGGFIRGDNCRAKISGFSPEHFSVELF